MQELFSPNVAKSTFYILSDYHIYALVGVLLLLSLVLFYTKICNDTNKLNRLRVGLAIFTILVEVSWHVWALSVGVWHVNHALPLHLCSLGAILSIFMLLKRRYGIFEVLYFWGIAGAVQAILTPDLRGYNFPHFHYFWYFTSHGMVVLAVLWMLIVEQVRPTWNSLRKTVLITMLYALAVYPINIVTGGNYMLLMHAPVVPTLADFLDVWPGYLFWLPVVALVVATICYLPFAIVDASRRYKNKEIIV
ncbi:MAG: TIGR02206 family membrane protein [Chloroflexi bacterium]|nr:TIGR02206 family membrane protein [Chloroflexota bacterium]